MATPAKGKNKRLPVTLCDNVSSLNRANDALRSSSYIVCDCEGSNLGAEGGNLSIISLAALPFSTNPEPYVYLIDTISLNDEHLKPIYDLLRSNKYTKIMYDARMDWSELYHRHGVELTHVLDLQLADVESRKARKETPEQQLARLPHFCSTEAISRERTSYAKVQRLNGLGPCTVEHGVVGPSENPKSKTFPHNKWNERPLWKKHLQYAAMDIHLICRLYLLFLQKGYIDESKLLVQSSRYMNLSRNRGIKLANSGHPLLPLDVLIVPPARASLLLCASCSRQLALLCFPRVRRDDSAERICWVCAAVKVHDAELAAKKKAQQEQQKQKAEESKRKREAEQAAAQQHGRAQQAGPSSVARRPPRSPRRPARGLGYMKGRSAAADDRLKPDSDGKFGIFGYDEEDIPGGTYYRDMYDSD